MTATGNVRFDQIAKDLGVSFDGEMKVGGNYVPVVASGNEIYVSGQIPRVGNAIAVTGRVGTDVSLAQAQHAARICVMRALALLRQSLGDLGRVRQVLRVTVYVQSAPDFTQQTEVADAASQVLHDVLGAAGTHTRTSIGVYQLPKNAAVELDLIATVD
ncbi:MAG: RidA family protein [Casimicrobiaceae bacterium]